MKLIYPWIQRRFDSFEDAKASIYEEGVKASLEDECPYEEGSWEAGQWYMGLYDEWLIY